MKKKHECVENGGCRAADCDAGLISVAPEIEAKIRNAAREGRIEVAPQNKLERVEDLAYDFVAKCLGHDECFITDESCISDFTMGDDEAIHYAIDQAQHWYGVDISDKINDYIVDIVEYIMIKREENNNGIQ